MNIKELLPNEKSKKKWKQGIISSNDVSKVFPALKIDPIIYRSSWELNFIRALEENPNVKNWGSECVEIPYLYHGAKHRYYPDFLVETVNGEIYLIEIKPYAQSHLNESVSKYNKKSCCKNFVKWAVAEKFANSRNIRFIVLTEKNCNFLKSEKK